MHQNEFPENTPACRFLAWSAAISCLLVSAAAAQAPPRGPEAKPQAPVASPLPPLPKVKGAIAKAPDRADGKVNGVNGGVFTALQTIKRGSPGSLTLKDAMALREAIIQDDQIDEVEADLLLEMTQSTFRNITVTKAGAAEKPPSVMTFPTVGHAKTVLRETLCPQLNLETAWAAGAPGWRDMIRESKENSEQEQRVAAFVQARVADAWEASKSANGYRPLRDLLAQRYGFSIASGLPADQSESARKLVINACSAVDAKADDQMPDFLYQWWKPAANP